MRRFTLLIAVAGVLVLAVFGVRWLVHRIRYVSTDDAQIRGELVVVAARHAGTILELTVAEGQRVARGDVVARFDDRAARAELERSRAARQRAAAESARAEARTLEIKRRPGPIEAQELDLAVLEAALRQAEAAERAAELRVEECTLRSPLDGIVARKIADAGETLGAGQPVAVLTDPAIVWVEANIKETALRRVAPGAAAAVRVDALPGRVLRGTVAAINAAANSQYALLPSGNPSGQFVKVTQRVAVRIALEERDPLLRAGLMAVVDIRAR